MLRSTAELNGWARATGMEATVQSIIREIGFADLDTVTGTPLFAQVASAIAAKALSMKADDQPGDIPQLTVAIYRWGSHRLGRQLLDGFGHKMGYRYLGGMASAASPCDIRLTIEDEALTVREVNGHFIAGFRPEHLIVAWSHSQREATTSSWFGLSVGHLIYFPDLTRQAGAMNIVFVTADGVRQVSIGNRRGLFSKSGDSRYYEGFVSAVGSWASIGAEARLSELGSAGYAAELGLEPRAEQARGGPSGRSPAAPTTTTTESDRLTAAAYATHQEMRSRLSAGERVAQVLAKADELGIDRRDLIAFPNALSESEQVAAGLDPLLVLEEQVAEWANLGDWLKDHPGEDAGEGAPLIQVFEWLGRTYGARFQDLLEFERRVGPSYLEWHQPPGAGPVTGKSQADQR